MATSDKKPGRETLCSFNKGRMLTRFEQYRRLVAQPVFFCRKCARVSAEAGWLCRPDSLTDPCRSETHETDETRETEDNHAV